MTTQKVFTGYRSIQEALQKTAKVFAIGNFDGLHYGHQEILRSAKLLSQELNAEFWIYTFKPHPRDFFGLSPRVEHLTTYHQRNELLSQAGAKGIVEEPFTPDLANLSAEFFVEQILGHHLCAAGVVVGQNFRFGRNRGGNVQVLAEQCTKVNIRFRAIDQFLIEGIEVSSSRIRKALLENQIGEANRCLGRPFFYEGNVVKGDQRGRKIGFPTANLVLSGQIVLPLGVYATQVCWRGQDFASITNVGSRPTFKSEPSESGSPGIVVETHLFGVQEEFYGERISVKFFEFLRPELKFSGIETLRVQIKKDVIQAQALFHLNPLFFDSVADAPKGNA